LVPEVREETRRQTVLVPDVRLEERQRQVTTVRKVPETQVRREVAAERVRVAVCDPCTGLMSYVCRGVPRVREGCVAVCREGAETPVESYRGAVPTVRSEARDVPVRVPGVREEMRSERVPVTSRKPVVVTYTVSVPVTKKVVETYEVPVCELKPKVETYTERVV